MLSQSAQLRGRFAHKITLPRFDWTNSDSRNEFLGVLNGFNALLSQKLSLPDLSDQGMALRLYLASGGLIGYVFNIIRRVVWDAVDNNTTSIQLKDFDNAYKAIVSAEDQHPISPFSPNFNFQNPMVFEKAKQVGVAADDYAPKKIRKHSK